MQFFSHLLVFGTLFVFCKTNMTYIGIHNWMSAAPKCGGQEKLNTLVDVTKDFINKAKNTFPDCAGVDEGKCGQMETAKAYLDVALNVVAEAKNGYPTCNTECPNQTTEKPMDCSEILRSGKKESGVYTIWPRNRIFPNKSLSVYCDMDTDGGGWTVIQRRGKFSTPKDFFYKDWLSYKKGFGNISEEFWLGNDNIFAISTQALYTIRFDVKDAEGKTAYAHYDTFWIGDESSGYLLHININSYRGNAGESMKEQGNMKFSTKDRKNDHWSKSCAVEFQSAWWFSTCAGYANLNGLYQPGVASYKGITWMSWKKDIGLSGVEIKLRV